MNRLATNRPTEAAAAAAAAAAATTTAPTTTTTYLLHDSSLALGESDVATRLVLDELDFDLSALATGLFFVYLVVTHATLGGAVVSSAVTGGLLQLVLGRGRVLLTDGSDVGHGGMRERERG